VIHRIYDELEEREMRREKKNELLVFSQLLAGCNINFNKIGERIREKR
jgi:hypothetical protein